MRTVYRLSQLGVCCGIAFTLVAVGCATSGEYARTSPLPEPEKITRISLPPSEGLPTSDGEAYYDPNGKRVRLYDTNGARGNKLGPYFVVGDFARSGSTQFRHARISPKLATCLNRLRAALNKPINVKSSYRSWQHNQHLRKTGTRASQRSYHISGLAADISVNVPVKQFVETFYGECGCSSGLGVANSFFHVDVRGSGVRPWGYGASVLDIRLAAARAGHRAQCRGGRDDTNELSGRVIQEASSAVSRGSDVVEKTGNTVKGWWGKLKERVKR